MNTFKFAALVPLVALMSTPAVSSDSPEARQRKTTGEGSPSAMPYSLDLLRESLEGEVAGSAGVDLPLGGSNEPAVAVSPTNSQNVAVASLWTLRVSTTGGASFGAQVSAVVDPGQVCCGDPSLAFDSQGRLFWTYLGCTLDLAGSPQFFDIYIAQVDTSTGAFLGGYPVNITASPGVNMPAAASFLHDKEWLAADASTTSPFRDNLYVVWTEFTGGPTIIWTTTSTDQGATWSSVIALSGGGEGFVWPCHNTVAPNGDVYVAYHSQPGFAISGGACRSHPNGTSGQVFVLRSTNGGGSYPQKTLAYTAGQSDMTYNTQTSGAAIPQTRFWLQGSLQPWVLADPFTPGRIYVVANDDPDNDPTAGDPANVYIAISADNGISWTAPSRIDGGPGTTFQVMPTAAIDKDSGCIVVHYYDNRNGATNAAGNFLLDVFYTVSQNQGVTFAPDVQLNDVPFDPDLGAPCRFDCSIGGPCPVNPTLRIGEYNGVAFDNTDIHAVWCGNTPGGQQTIFDKEPDACEVGLNPVKFSQLPVVCVCNGDVNNDGSIDIAFDVTPVLDCINGDCSFCINSCDVNCDGIVDAADADTVLCLFSGLGPNVCCPLGEDIPSNIDWTDMDPNVVVVDDFVSDGRPIDAVRWWGSDLVEVSGPVDCDVTNGGFESGDFAGWTTVTGPGSQLVPWTVSAAPGSGWFGGGFADEGIFYAENGFDGQAGLFYDIYQEVAIPAGASSAVLDWSERIQWSMGGTLPRTYEVTLQPAGGGAPMATLYTQLLAPGTDGFPVAYTPHSVDLLLAAPGIAGSTVRINWHEFIPETFTGPAQFELDAVRLTCTAALGAESVTLLAPTQSRSGSRAPEIRQSFEELRAKYAAIRERALARTSLLSEGSTRATEARLFTKAPDISVLGDGIPDERQLTTSLGPGGTVVADGGFEAGTPNPSWTEASTTFGTPLCDILSCGTGTGTGPHSGDWWCWFGGIAATETGSVEQNVTIPVGADTLEFYLENSASSGNGTDFMNVLIDGINLFTVLEGDATYATYALVSLNIAAFGDGGSHLLRFESSITGVPGVTNFFVDDVVILEPDDNRPDGWFISFHEPCEEGAPPLPPLALYFCDKDIVTQTPTSLPACDAHPVIEYLVNLENCCLVHANADSRSGFVPAAKDAFFEEQCFEYAIDIQAVFGHRYLLGKDTPQCIEVQTGNTIDRHTWGWHTTSIERGRDFGLQQAFQSPVTMAGPDWLYGPWEPVEPVCSVPNMAFELLTNTPGNSDLDGDGIPDKCVSCECDADLVGVDVGGFTCTPDGLLTVQDISYLISCLANQADLICGRPLSACDVNCDGAVDEGDTNAYLCRFRGFSEDDCCGECDPLADPPAPEPSPVMKSRYISFVPGSPGKMTALRVTLTASAQFPAEVGDQWWVVNPQTVCQNSGQTTPPPPPGRCQPLPPSATIGNTLEMATLGCISSPQSLPCHDWGSLGLIHVESPNIAPDATYLVEAIDCECPNSPGNYSAGLSIDTSGWVDICGPSAAGVCSAGPDGLVDINDVIAINDTFVNNQFSLVKSRVDLASFLDLFSNQVDRLISVDEKIAWPTEFETSAGYPFSGPTPCP